MPTKHQVNSPIKTQNNQRSDKEAKDRPRSMKQRRDKEPRPTALDVSLVSPKLKAQMDYLETLKDQDQLRLSYMKTLMYPESYSYRAPDETTLPTVLYRSCREFSIVANMNPALGVDVGRFSFAMQPVFGSTSTTQSFQVGIVNNTAVWPTAYSNPATYVSDIRGDDPRVDPYLDILTSDSSGQFYHVDVDSQSFSTGNVWEGDPFKFITPALVNTLDISAVIGSSPIFDFGVSLNGSVQNAWRYSIPAGTYNLNLINRGTYTSVLNGALRLLCLSINDQNIVDGAFTLGFGISFATYGYMINKAERLDATFEQWQVASENILIGLAINFNTASDHTYVFALAAVGQNLTATNFACGLCLTATSDSSLNGVSNSGIIIKARPVAMSALFTCTLPDINAGGNIVGYSAPSGDVHNYYYNTSQSVGPFQNWEVLARNNKGMCTHDGNLKQGTYVFTQPWDKNDMLFRTPLELNAYPYQGIIISGQVNPSVGYSGLIEIGRLRVITIFEYTTDSRLFDPQACIGSGTDVDFVLSMLSQVDHAYENNDHLKRLGDFLKKGAKFVGANIPTMIKGLQLASTFI